MTSAVAVLTVLAPPGITAQPQSLTSIAGTTASFSAAATGSSPLNYQWRFNGINLADGGQISGSGGATLTVSNVQAANAGSYSVVVTNAAAAATSATATLTVAAPTIPQYEAADIGAVWSDNFNRSSLGANWIILGGANATIVSNQLCLAQTDDVPARRGGPSAVADLFRPLDVALDRAIWGTEREQSGRRCGAVEFSGPGRG